jgi:hypothetical protein
MVSPSYDPAFLPGFDPDSGSEVPSKMRKATMMMMMMMMMTTRRHRTCLNQPQKEQQTNLFS